MRQARRQTNLKLGTDSFDSSVIEAARLYHLQTSAAATKGYVPVAL
jgi:hypothetical protein